MRQTIGLNVATCHAQLDGLNCSSFFKNFPEYSQNAMRCEPYEVCKLALESTTTEGCRRFGIEIKQSVLSALQTASKCTTNLSCMTSTALSGLRNVIFPAAAAGRIATAAVQTLRDDASKFKQMGCLDPETQAQFQCYLLASYGGAVSGAGGIIRAGTAMARMASLGTKLSRGTSRAVSGARQRIRPRPTPFAVRPTGRPSLAALDNYTASTGTKLSIREQGNRSAIVDPQGRELFELKYGLRSTSDGKMYFNNVVAAVNEKYPTPVRRNGFYSHMMHRMFRENPSVRKIKADLQNDNAAVINRYVQEGHSIEEAIKQSPSYRVYQENGFTKIDQSSVLVNRDNNGQIFQIQYFAEKP